MSQYRLLSFTVACFYSWIFGVVIPTSCVWGQQMLRARAYLGVGGGQSIAKNFKISHFQQCDQFSSKFSPAALFLIESFAWRQFRSRFLPAAQFYMEIYVFAFVPLVQFEGAPPEKIPGYAFGYETYIPLCVNLFSSDGSTWRLWLHRALLVCVHNFILKQFLYYMTGYRQAELHIFPSSCVIFLVCVCTLNDYNLGYVPSPVLCLLSIHPQQRYPFLVSSLWQNTGDLWRVVIFVATISDHCSSVKYRYSSVMSNTLLWLVCLSLP